MKKKQLCAILAIVLIVILAVFGFLYTRPVDVYALAPSFEPEIISISLVRTEASLADDSSEERFAYFEKGDNGYQEALDVVNSLRFRRSPLTPLWKRIPALVPSDDSVKEINDYEYHIYLHLGEQGEDWAVYLSCWIDQWDYWDNSHKVSIPITGDGTAADAKVLGDLWWNIATPLDSFDIENKE